MNHSLSITVDQETNTWRLDKVLSANCMDMSRARIQQLIKDGHAKLNGDKITQSSYKVKAGDEILLDIPPPKPWYPQAENIPLDVIYEDNDLIVINKQAGLVVHPGAGNKDGTLVSALLHHCGDSLSGIGGVLRPGIVHRLDKDTTGLMIVAKNDRAHKGLAKQLSSRTLSRVYHAVVLSTPVPPKGRIDKPIGRHRTNRLKMTVMRGAGNSAKEAQTHYKVLQKYGLDACSLVECKLESGRTHQIRVHMESIKHPLVGDSLYGPQYTALKSRLKKSGYEQSTIDSVLSFSRPALHAKAISFVHPVTGYEHSFESELPSDMSNLLKILDL